MDNTNKGLIFDIQRYSIHDGPGIRSVAFFKGCPLRCRWCSNPESQIHALQLMHSKTKCKMCGKCIMNCPNKALSMLDGKVNIDRGICKSCGECVESCFYGGWKFAGKWYSANELMEELLKDEMCYIASNGGITIGGGEPFGQHVYLKELLEKCHTRGLNTAVETCGYVKSSILEETLPYIDALLMDIKHIDDAKHREWTGVSNRQILDNWKIAVKNARNIILRVPVIPGFNDTEGEIGQIADFAASIGVKEIHLLQYHRMGEGKYESLGLTYRLNGILPPPDERMNHYAHLAQEKGLKSQIGG